MSRKFDRFMVTNDNGRSLKWARFTDAEFRALIQGILPIASMASPRGSFMVGGQPATAEDVAFLAPKVTARTAEKAIKKMRELGMLEHDPELGGEWVHDWDDVNPTPKSDPTGAKRQKAWRERQKAARNGAGDAVTPPVTETGETLPEVEGEEEVTPQPPRGGDSQPLIPGLGEVYPSPPLKQRQTDLASFATVKNAWARRHFPAVEVKIVDEAVVHMRGYDDKAVTPARLRAFLQSPAGQPFAHYFSAGAAA